MVLVNRVAFLSFRGLPMNISDFVLEALQILASVAGIGEFILDLLEWHKRRRVTKDGEDSCDEWRH